ncbi:hypothetical protein HPB47_006964 [Ixodes persulcatus]|uniref:Uncharacterized protein n=1 Tax=Ixodes persulcatus TaxID=34615 RepID=A0AC60P8W0_IXOPE|nr:hypothetical protein HPB47_006964 [Ixodes persulcatus]
MSFYPMQTKTKKWTVREIAHFASFSLANSWLEYVRDADKERLLKKNTMGMLAFQTNVAHSLITRNKMAQKKRGRPSNESPQPVAKKAHNTEPPPTNTVRYDGCYQHPSGKDKKVKVNTTMIFPRELALLLAMVSKEVLKPQQWLGRRFYDLVLPSKEQVVVLNVQVVGQRIGLSEAHHLKVAKYSVPEVIDQVRGNSFPGIQCDPLLPGCVGGRECWVPGRFRF